MQYTRNGVGDYRITIGGLGSYMSSHGGTVKVSSANNTSERCKVVSWEPAKSDVNVLVACFAPTGARADSSFHVSFTKALGLTANQAGWGAYVWANQPVAAAYTPSLPYAYNASGAGVTVQRTAVGSYVVNMPGQERASGPSNVQVTGYGADSSFCNVQTWGANSATVKCVGANGAPIDAMFTLQLSR